MFHLLVWLIVLDGGALAGLLGIASFKAMKGDVVLFHGDPWHRAVLYFGAMLIVAQTIATLIFDAEHPLVQFPFRTRVILTAVAMAAGTYALFPMLFKKNQGLKA
jgi:hypothetical protein